MTAPFVRPALERTLAAVFRFYDAFTFPIDETTPPIASPLEVSIPALRWTAFHAAGDRTYRFSALTLTSPPPAGVNLAVNVIATNGDYVNLDPILLTLPLPLSTPPVPVDFLIPRPLWPTLAFRPPQSETAIRGRITSPTAQPVAGLRVEMWPGAASVPPPGTPFTRSSENGDFLVRFPLLKGASGSSITFNIRLDSGAVAVVPASVPVVLGATRIISFQRT